MGLLQLHHRRPTRPSCRQMTKLPGRSLCPQKKQHPYFKTHRPGGPGFAGAASPLVAEDEGAPRGIERVLLLEMRGGSGGPEEVVPLLRGRASA
jgi:hypothetical protein